MHFMRKLLKLLKSPKLTLQDEWNIQLAAHKVQNVLESNKHQAKVRDLEDELIRLKCELMKNTESNE